jgi:hypothetical protein
MDTNSVVDAKLYMDINSNINPKCDVDIDTIVNAKLYMDTRGANRNAYIPANEYMDANE